MQRLEVSGAVGPIYGSLGVKRLTNISQPSDHVSGLLYTVGYTACNSALKTITGDTTSASFFLSG